MSLARARRQSPVPWTLTVTSTCSASISRTPATWAFNLVQRVSSTGGAPRSERDDARGRKVRCSPLRAALLRAKAGESPVMKPLEKMYSVPSTKNRPMNPSYKRRKNQDEVRTAGSNQGSRRALGMSQIMRSSSSLCCSLHAADTSHPLTIDKKSDYVKCR